MKIHLACMTNSAFLQERLSIDVSKLAKRPPATTANNCLRTVAECRESSKKKSREIDMFTIAK